LTLSGSVRILIRSSAVAGIDCARSAVPPAASNSASNPSLSLTAATEDLDFTERTL